MRVIVLKGCAYLLRGVCRMQWAESSPTSTSYSTEPISPRPRTLLVHNGWSGRSSSAYDQHYYRAWTHELPPLIHIGTERSKPTSTTTSSRGQRG